LTVIVNVIGLLHPGGNLPRDVFGNSSRLLVATLADATFISQWLGQNVSNSVNPVFWSLSYECSYYLLFGLILFGRGRKLWIGVGGICILLGLPILLLFPVWLSGCVAHDIYQRLRVHRSAWVVVTGGLATVMIGCLALQDAIRSFLVWLKGTSAIRYLLTFDDGLHRRNLHIFQRASPSFYVVGIPTAILLIWLLLLADRVQKVIPMHGLRWVRWAADGTFALYLMHHALFVLFADFVPYPKGNLIVKCLILVVTVGLCIAVSAPMEDLKFWFRRVMHGRQYGLLAAVK
jgi:peptidoglycan/LPS O-acetylase OafA/YrhL